MLLWQLNLQSTDKVNVYWLEVEQGGAANFDLFSTPGVYNITGASASLNTDRLLQSTPGSYSITGATSSLNTSRLLQSTAGSYSITGATANLIYTPATGYLLESIAGSYSITGSNANLLYSPVLATTPGSYSITFSDALLEFTSADKTLGTIPGVYNLSFTPADLRYSGDAQILKPGGRGLSPWQLKQQQLEALKKELWYLYQDENDEEVKEALLEVVRDDTPDVNDLDTLLTVLKKQLTFVKNLYDKAQQEQYQKAFEAAEQIKVQAVKKKRDEEAIMLLF